MKVKSYDEHGVQKQNKDLPTTVVVRALNLSLIDDDIMSITAVFNDGTSFVATP